MVAVSKKSDKSAKAEKIDKPKKKVVKKEREIKHENKPQITDPTYRRLARVGGHVYVSAETPSLMRSNGQRLIDGILSNARIYLLNRKAKTFSADDIRRGYADSKHNEMISGH